MSRAFTLLELIIVIALIGVLATGLIVALDPIQQINRGRDSNMVYEASQVARAIERYYSDTAQSGNPGLPWTGTYGSYAYPVVANKVTNSALTSISELKDYFPGNMAGINGLLIWAENDTSGFVCFTPQSNAFKLDPLTKYTFDGPNGSPVTGCTTGSEGNCTEWCLPLGTQ